MNVAALTSAVDSTASLDPALLPFLTPIPPPLAVFGFVLFDRDTKDRLSISRGEAVEQDGVGCRLTLRRRRRVASRSGRSEGGQTRQGHGRLRSRNAQS